MAGKLPKFLDSYEMKCMDASGKGYSGILTGQVKPFSMRVKACLMEDIKKTKPKDRSKDYKFVVTCLWKIYKDIVAHCINNGSAAINKKFRRLLLKKHKFTQFEVDILNGWYKWIKLRKQEIKSEKLYQTRCPGKWVKYEGNKCYSGRKTKKTPRLKKMVMQLEGNQRVSDLVEAIAKVESHCAYGVDKKLGGKFASNIDQILKWKTKPRNYFW